MFAEPEMIKNLAPHVFRQRLLIEGFYTIAVDRDCIEQYLLGLTASLALRTYGAPIIFTPDTGMGSGENAGYDAFVPLIDSGISAYFWSNAKFFSIVIYTCKGFDETGRDRFHAHIFCRCW
jgi:hypothetical protein